MIDHKNEDQTHFLYGFPYTDAMSYHAKQYDQGLEFKSQISSSHIELSNNFNTRNPEWVILTHYIAT